MKQKDAAEFLSLSCRQVRTIVRKVKLHGDKSIAHGSRGKPSPRKFSDEFREDVITIVKRKYYDFGPTFASEKLGEIDRKKVNKETLRQWMIEKLIWIPRKLRAGAKDRRWRKRKECFGEMIQTDGSIHDWLEGRGPKMVLMAYIDDATGIVWAEFYPAETTESAMKSFRAYIKNYGIPVSIYFDRNSIYKTTRQPNLDESLKGKTSQTQFEKVLEILKVEPIPAYSPEAKGRVERLFKTFQDRLIKEMRLASISNMKQANRFLKYYLPKYNAKFSIPPANPKDLHRTISETLDLNWVFSIRDERLLSNDLTVSWKNRIFLIEKQSVILRKKRVIVLENLKGQIRIWFNDRYLEFKEITKDTLQQRRKQKKSEEMLIKNLKTMFKNKKKPYKSKPNHPWRHRPFGKALYM
jgi:hypothetical protein